MMNKTFTPCAGCTSPKACKAAGKCLKNSTKSRLRGMANGGMKRSGY